MRYNIGKGYSVDTETGDISKYVKERFLYLRTTDDLDWMKGLSSTEIRAMLFLCKRADYDCKLEMTVRVRALLVKELGVSERQYYNILNKLMRVGLVKRIAKAYYAIAPYTAYKFHSKNMGQKVLEYLEV